MPIDDSGAMMPFADRHPESYEVVIRVGNQICRFYNKKSYEICKDKESDTVEAILTTEVFDDGSNTITITIIEN